MTLSRTGSAVLATCVVLVATGCGSLRGDRMMVSEDGTVYAAADIETPSAATGAGIERPVVAVEPDAPAPTALRFAASRLDGGVVTGAQLSELGAVHLVFFQPSCEFSQEEAPKLAAAASRHPELTYVVAHSGGTADDYRQMAAAAGLDAPNVVHLDDSDQALWERFAVTASPSSILVDAAGLMRSSYGALGDSGLDRAADVLAEGF